MEKKSSIKKYGVELVPLSHDKIEMVRQWRNDSKIQQYMEFCDIITPEMQEKWFNNINNEYNLYYIIKFEKCEIGLINVKDINKTLDEGECGCFIYDDRYLNRDISYRAHLALFDELFFNRNYKGLRSHIKTDNKRSIRFSLFVGYQLVTGTDTEYYVSKESYLNNKNRIRFVKRENLLINNK